MTSRGLFGIGLLLFLPLLAGCGKDENGVSRLGDLLTSGADLPAGAPPPAEIPPDIENTRPSTFGGRMEVPPDPQRMSGMSRERQAQIAAAGETDDGLFGLGQVFGSGTDPNSTVRVNRYIWRASLETLDFLPVEAADPFSGIITTSWGRPPGANRDYRATIFVQDPALDARSLKVALFDRNGPVAAETARQVEDAILTRARQLRVADSRL